MMQRAEALAIAEQFIAQITDVSEQVMIAGSIRRRRPQVNDIEIVCTPRLHHIPADLFGGTQPVNLLSSRCVDLLESGIVAKRLDIHGRVAWGERYKRVSYEGAPLDLFITTPEQFGGILAIRTGPAKFSRICVTPRITGGAMPAGMRQEDGVLWQGKYPLACPTEVEWFDALGLPCLEPEERTRKRLIARLGRDAGWRS